MPPTGRPSPTQSSIADAGAARGRPGDRSLFQGLALVVVVTLLGLAIGWSTPGYEGDINQNKDWARTLVRNGMHEAYRANIDYPPVPLYVFAAAGWVYQSVYDPSFNQQAAQASQAFTFLMKLPVIACHALLAGLLFWLAAPRGALAASLVAGAYGLNPAMLYDVAHFGQTDPFIGLAAVGTLAALRSGRLILFGCLAAVLMLTKPQGWPLLPIVGLMLLRDHRVKGLWLAALGGALATGVILAPWILGDRVHQLGRFVANLEAHDISNRVISADAHNLWWIPTLVHWDWIEDSAPLLGPLSYRTVAIALALIWLAACGWAAWRGAAEPFLITAAASFGFFMLMTRAHENHAYLALALLAGSLAVLPGRQAATVYGLGSIGLLLNLALRDPLVMGQFTSAPDPGQDAPFVVVALQAINVAINGVVLAGLGWLALRRASSIAEAQPA